MKDARTLSLPRPWKLPYLPPVVCAHEVTSDDVVRWFGAPMLVDEAGDGLGPERGWAFGFPCGLEVVLIHRPARSYLDIVPDALEPEHALRHVELPAGMTIWRSPMLAELSRPAPWAVWRQDDNGNQFLMKQAESERDAKCIAAEFEARGHKQLYWCEPVNR